MQCYRVAHAAHWRKYNRNSTALCHTIIIHHHHHHHHNHHHHHHHHHHRRRRRRRSRRRRLHHHHHHHHHSSSSSSSSSITFSFIHSAFLVMERAGTAYRHSFQSMKKIKIITFNNVIELLNFI